jgi:hypothetical protein
MIIYFVLSAATFKSKEHVLCKWFLGSWSKWNNGTSILVLLSFIDQIPSHSLRVHED